MRVQTADKNFTIIHTTPVYQLTACEVKSCLFETNYQGVLTLIHFNAPHVKKSIT